MPLFMSPIHYITHTNLFLLPTEDRNVIVHRNPLCIKPLTLTLTITSPIVVMHNNEFVGPYCQNILVLIFLQRNVF